MMNSHVSFIEDLQSCLICVARRAPLKERPALPSSESFTTRQDLQGKFLSEDRSGHLKMHGYLGPGSRAQGVAVTARRGEVPRSSRPTEDTFSLELQAAAFHFCSPDSVWPTKPRTDDSIFKDHCSV